MFRKNIIAVAIGVAVGAGSWAIADSTKDVPAAASSEFKLPAGWTKADMEACMAAGTPGKAQEELMKGAGEWHGKTTMWMSPGSEAMTSECTLSAKPIMDGRFLKVEISGEMPGMGPYTGLGFYGYDNVGKNLVGTWMDNHSTGIMHGTGKASADGKVTTFSYTYQCPITQKPTTMCDVETITGPNTKTMESYGIEPKTGKEFKMMRVELTRKS